MRWLRTTRVLWLFPVLTGLLLGQMVLDPEATWPGWWQRTTMQIHTTSLMILGPAGIAASAWLVAVARERGLLGSQAAVPTTGARLVARLVLPVWLCCIAAFAVLLCAACLRSASVSSGMPTWSLALLTVAFLALQVSFGALAGVWLPKLAAPPLAVITLMTLTSAQLYVYGGERTWGRLLPVLQQPFWDPALRAADPRILVASTWLMASSALLLVLAGLRRPLTPPRWTRLIGLVTTSGVLAALVLLPDVPEGQAAFADPIGPRDSVVCEPAGRGKVCVREGQRDLLPTFEAAYERLHEIAGDLHAMPATLVEAGIGADGGVEVPLVERRPTVTSILVDVVAQLPSFSPSGCARALEPALGDDQWSDVFSVLVLRRAGLEASAEGGQSVARLERLSRAEQDAWLDRAQSAVAACRAVPAIP